MYTDIDGNNDYQGNKRIYAKESQMEKPLIFKKKKKSFKTVGSVSRITTFPKPFLFLSHIYCGWKSMGRSGAPSGGVGASGVQLADHRAGLSGQRPSRLADQASTPHPTALRVPVSPQKRPVRPLPLYQLSCPHRGPCLRTKPSSSQPCPGGVSTQASGLLP